MSPYLKHSITLSEAETMARAAIHKATELGLAICITVVDESGITKLFSRMDQAPLIAVDASKKKALTAVGYGIPTGESWFNFIKDDPILREGVHGFRDFMLMGGGMPVIADGQVIGAIGISGGHYTHDQQCAQAALDSLSYQP